MSQGGDASTLASALLEHVSCGGALDVDRSDSGRIAVHCSGCGARFTYTLPALDDESVRPGLTQVAPGARPEPADPEAEAAALEPEPAAATEPASELEPELTPEPVEEPEPEPEPSPEPDD